MQKKKKLRRRSSAVWIFLICLSQEANYLSSKTRIFTHHETHTSTSLDMYTHTHTLASLMPIWQKTCCTEFE